MGVGKTLDWWDAWTEKMRLAHGNGNGHGNSLSIEAKRTKTWADYLPALQAWRDVVERPWPEALTAGEINPAFMEWMMGLPAGWVCDTPDLTNAQARKALGNGVVPQQAAAALRWMLSRVYDYCAQYAIDPGGYRLDNNVLAGLGLTAAPAMVQARERVAQRCGGFVPGDKLPRPPSGGGRGRNARRCRWTWRRLPGMKAA